MSKGPPLDKKGSTSTVPSPQKKNTHPFFIF